MANVTHGVVLPVVPALTTLAVMLVAFVPLLLTARAAQAERTTLRERRDRLGRGDRWAAATQRQLGDEVERVHGQIQSVLAMLRGRADQRTAQQICAGAREPITALRDHLAQVSAQRPDGVGPPPHQSGWAGVTIAALLAVGVPIGVAHILLGEPVVVLGVSVVALLVAAVATRSVVTARRRAAASARLIEKFTRSARARSALDAMYRAYGEYLELEVGRFLQAIGDGYIRLDDATREGARVLSLRLESAKPVGRQPEPTSAVGTPIEPVAEYSSRRSRTGG